MTEQGTKRGQWQVWAMIAMLVGVIAAGFLLFPKTEEARNSLLSKLGTTNHGEFVVPAVSMTELSLVSNDKAPWQFADQKIKWRMVIAGSGECLGKCREMLYLTRQVHISLGKYSRRFERLYFALDDELTQEASEYIKLNHPFLKVLYGSKNELESVLESTNAPLNKSVDGTEKVRAYLVDQKGLIMMSYTLENEGSEMIEDIEHLMKYSPKQ